MSDLRVRDLMTETVVTVRPSDSIDRTYDAMNRHNIRHLAVVDADGDLVGVVSHRDLLRHALIEQVGLPLFIQRAVLLRTQVEEIMTSEIETAEPDQPLAEAAQLIFDGKLGCLPVVEGCRVVGILTESDFVRYFTETSARRDRPAPRPGLRSRRG